MPEQIAEVVRQAAILSNVDLTRMGASSDHLVLDVTEASPPVHLGEELAFRPGYGSVATAMASAAATHVITGTKTGSR